MDQDIEDQELATFWMLSYWVIYDQFTVQNLNYVLERRMRLPRPSKPDLHIGRICN